MCTLKDDMANVQGFVALWQKQRLSRPRLEAGETIMGIFRGPVKEFVVLTISKVEDRKELIVLGGRKTEEY